MSAKPETQSDTSTKLSKQQTSILMQATQKMAPNWPLDKLIAVNPLWSLVDKPCDKVADELSALAGIKTHLPIETYVQWYKAGRIQQDALIKAANHYHLNYQPAELLELLAKPNPSPLAWQNIADLADQTRPATKMSWEDELTHQVSQFCAAHYQQRSPTLRQVEDNQAELYVHWLEITREDKGLSIILDETSLTDYFKQLPNTKHALFATAISELQLDDEVLACYSHSLLLDMNGWSSYLAYLNFHADDHKDSHLMALLAIKMAWELVIWRYLSDHQPSLKEAISQQWLQQKQTITKHISSHKNALLTVKVWALALEYSEQEKLSSCLASSHKKQQSTEPPEVQAIFCIDVRSEVYRRALEKQSDAIQTLGFAGFFGLPIEYQAKDSHFSRPQLPGLLPASITATEVSSDIKHVENQQQQARWQRWGYSAPATFSMVESMGWWYAFKMFKQTLFPKRQNHPANRLSPNTEWQLTQAGVSLTTEDKASLAQGILDTMGIKYYAPTVLLVGHGSHTSNNLHAAAYECGACGGQSGEVNVKVLAALLNDPKVRSCLKDKQVMIPDNTQFVAALHNTTTDHLSCFDVDVNELNKSQLSTWLQQATFSAQKERANKLDSDLVEMTEQARDKAFIKRSNDWSQVVPEWGLANNHSFIIAPRSKTRDIDLNGRSFLHDYDYQNDGDYAILERLLTAPMLVTHWINMQYNMSVTDNFKFGSGNKVLHNAVGGNIGIFEGNGGDLRIGLPMQSINNGSDWMHTPVRLSVYISASREAIEHIAAKHDIVRQLIDNDWLYLFRWQDETIERFYQQKWE
jgi:uncharacterized protein YbcC (UPF0753/DUF2309 family)